VLPAILERMSGSRTPSRKPAQHSDPDKAQFILERTVSHLEKVLTSVKPSTRRSRWSGYDEDFHSKRYQEFKAELVGDALRTHKPATVLDLGCNTGRHSILAARAGSRVVAVDSDIVSVGKLFNSAKEEALHILPLVLDLNDPSPGRGWRNREYLPFVDRARNQFEMVLAMSLVHHLMITGGIPLEEILSFLGDLSSNLVMLEFVPRDDPMFVALARGRDALYAEHTRDRFAAVCERDFTILRSEAFAETGREVFIIQRKKK
jgi:SAM-dependent methyltransferase